MSIAEDWAAVMEELRSEREEHIRRRRDRGDRYPEREEVPKRARGGHRTAEIRQARAARRMEDLRYFMEQVPDGSAPETCTHRRRSSAMLATVLLLLRLGHPGALG